jgi:uncharacterized protein
LKFKFPTEMLRLHTAVLGMTGSGKSSTARLLIEQVVREDDARVCILDPIKSDWWGITSSADGTRAGLPFTILGGPHGHVPLNSSAGKPIADLVGRGELRHSIIDMQDFEAGGLQRFFLDFADQLMRSLKGVLYLVLEEAHEFAPKERAGFDKENKALHYAKKLATAGRSKGVRLVVATQRTQQLHNSLLGSCQVMVAHRITFPDDQAPVVKWLNANAPKDTAKEMDAALSDLKDGEGFLVSKVIKLHERVQFPRITTFDNSKTPEGDDLQDVKTAPIDAEALKVLIGSALEEAQANDPKTLKATIVKLEKRLGDGFKAHNPAGAPIGSYERGLAQGMHAGKESGLKLGWELGYARGAKTVREEITSNALKLLEGLNEIVHERLELVCQQMRLQAAIKDYVPPGFTPDLEQPNDAIFMPKIIPENSAPASRRKLEAPALQPSSFAGIRREGDLATFDPDRPVEAPKGEIQHKILDVLYEIEQLGSNIPSRELVATMTGYHPGTKSFRAALAQMRVGGLIDYPNDGTISMHPNARQYARPRPKPRSDVEHHERIYEMLGGEVPRRALQPLLTIYPSAMSRAQLASSAGYHVGTKSFRAALAQLRSLGFIEYPQEGQVQATQAMFLYEEDVMMGAVKRPP